MNYCTYTASIFNDLSLMSFADCCHIAFALELIMLRAGILCTPVCVWSRLQIDCIAMLAVIGTRDCS